MVYCSIVLFCEKIMKKFVILLVAVLAVGMAIAAVPQPKYKAHDLLEELPQFPTNSKSKVSGESRITNGEIAKPGQFPYQVGLSLQIGSQNGWCGGSMISTRYVLTAAHCTERADGVTIYFGAHDIRDLHEATQQRVYCGKNAITVHENWSRLTLTNDISVIKTPVEIAFNEFIQAIKLPQKRTTYPSYDNQIATASGWGKESDEAVSVSPLLRFIDVPIMPLRRCNVMYLNVTTENMICIDTEGAKSTCNGDSGGPLVITENNERVLIGATSFGISLGCEKEWPGVFTRVTSYLDWIQEKTGVVNN